MLCLKIRHRVLIYSLPLLFAVVCSLFFGRSSASAISYSFTLDSSNISSINYLCFDNESSVGRNCFDYNYMVITLNSVLPDTTPSYNFPSLRFNIAGRSSSRVDFNFLFNSYTVPLDFINNSSTYYAFYLPSNPISNSNYLPADWSISITLYDSLPSDCPPVPDCPPIPETQYGDILGKIYKAILLVPAMAFVLYLFYILFGWYVGGRR